MRKEDAEQLIENTEKLTSYYQANINKKIIITELSWIKDYPYKFSKLEGIASPVSLGITDRYFGGQVHKAAKIKDKPYYILVDKDDTTIGLLIRDEDVPNLSYQDLQKLAIKYKLECGSKAKKEEIVDQLLTK